MYEEVTLLRQKNMGVSSARNNGAMMAEFEWIAFLDSDDTWSEDKLQKQVAFHKQHKSIEISYTDEKWIRNDEEVKVPKKYTKSDANLYERSLDMCIIAPSSIVMKKKLYDKFSGFDEDLEVCEDYDLWLRIMKKHSFGLINEKLMTKYAGEENQLSFKHWGMDRFRVRTLESLHVEYPEDKKIVDMLIQKYEILKLGAIKHKREEEVFHYEERLNELNVIIR